MGKDKLRRFAENLTFECFVQPAFEEAFRRDHPLKGHWHSDFFHNDRPIVLELGCGKGEYTVALAERDPGRNFIGIDIKGARMWRGAKTATERQMRNVGFLRTRIEMIASFFAVIGVLSDDYHFEFVERAFVEGTKNVASSGEYPAGSVFLPYEVGEFSEIGFFELFGKNLFPVRSDFNIHGWY